MDNQYMAVESILVGMGHCDHGIFKYRLFIIPIFVSKFEHLPLSSIQVLELFAYWFVDIKY
jgi:hypothetical protein